MDNHPYEETMLISLVNLSSTTLNGVFYHLVCKIDNIPNDIRATVAMGIIWHLNV